ncbi:MAG: hypothetical protein ACREU6_05060 [Steroidobacteraceae bacterium]
MSDFSDAQGPHDEAVTSCTPAGGVGPYFAANGSPTSRKDSTMHADSAVTAELPKLNLPEDLLTEVKRGGPKSKADFGIEGLQPSLFGRLVEKLLGKPGR